ncbi:MAG: hypothetical protein M3163_01960 [Actinomycetota bacterium]|nr:hypothetical protein [Actinomycetota bacterium]
MAVCVALWLTAGAWGEGLLPGADTMAHMVRAEFAISELFSSGRTDGWHPGFITGYQEFLFIGPGFTMAVALVHWLSLGLISVPGAFKIVVIASFAALPLSVAFLARSVGLGRRASAAAAILSLAVNSPFGGVGLTGTFDVGLMTHLFAAPFFFLALGGTMRLLRRSALSDEPAPHRRIAFTAVVLAVLLASHGISVIVLGALLAVMVLMLLLPVPVLRQRRNRVDELVRREVQAQLNRLGLEPEPDALTSPEVPDARPEAPERPDQASLRRTAIVFLISGGLAAFVLGPFLGHHNLRGILSAWGTPPIGQRLTEIWRGDLLFRPGVAALVLAGFAYGITRVARGRPYALVLVATPLTFLVIAHVAIRLWPGSVVTPQLTTRALGYIAVLALLPLAALIARGTRDLGVLGDVGMLAVAIGIVVVPIGDVRDSVFQDREPIPAMREAARQLSTLVPDGRRFVTQRDFPGEISRTNVVNPDRWLAWASGRNTLNNFNVESSSSPGPAFESDHVTDRPPEALADALSRLGTTHIVTVSDEAAARLAASPRFVQAWRASPLAIFGVTPMDGQPDPAALITADAPLSAEAVRVDPEHVVIDVNASEATRAIVPIGYSPKWHARLDGRSLPLQRSPEGLLQLQLPAGPSDLTLEFRRDMWDWAGLLITVITAAWGCRELVRRRRRRQPSP